MARLDKIRAGLYCHGAEHGLTKIKIGDTGWDSRFSYCIYGFQFLFQNTAGLTLCLPASSLWLCHIRTQFDISGYWKICHDMPHSLFSWTFVMSEFIIYTTKQWHSDVVAVIFVGVYPVALSLLCVTPLCEISSDGIVVQMWWYSDCWLANSGRVWRFTNLQHLHINFDTLTYFGLAHLNILSRLCQFVWPFFLPPLPSLRVTAVCVCEEVQKESSKEVPQSLDLLELVGTPCEFDAFLRWSLSPLCCPSPPPMYSYKLVTNQSVVTRFVPPHKNWDCLTVLSVRSALIGSKVCMRPRKCLRQGVGLSGDRSMRADIGLE
jgi:hypothetical protein